MKNTILSLCICALAMPVCLAQPVDQQESSPYRINKKVDYTILGVAGVANAVGLYIITSKDRLTPAEAIAADRQDIPKFDRWAAGNYNPDAKLASDFLAYGSLTFPLLLLTNDRMRADAGTLAVLYLQTMAIEDAQFIFTAGLTNRKRPLVYSETAPMEERTAKPNQNSFFAGHTAASAAASMFTAKVFHDYNPDSPWRPVVWGAAALVPATVGYLRLEAGKHFLSDNIIGYTVGSLTGILVPELHRRGKGDGRMSFIPVCAPYKGLRFTYKM